MERIDLSGIWAMSLEHVAADLPPACYPDEIRLPDSTSHAQKGPRNHDRHPGHLTDPYAFEGCLRVRRQRKSPEWEKSLSISFFFGAIGFLWLPFWLGMTALQWSRDGEKALLLLLFLPLLWPVQLVYLNWWLRYDDAGFTWHGPLFGKARSFRYAR